MFLPEKACFDEEARYWLSVSSGVKITKQGLLFLSSPVLFGKAPSYPCLHSIGALCQTDNYTFFPCTDSPRTRVTDATPPFNAFWIAETAACSKRPTLYAFDVLPCDLQHGTTVLWSEGRIAVQHSMDMSYWANIGAMCIMVWLIVNLGETISLLLDVSNNSHHHTTVVLCLILCTIVFIDTPLSLWATASDLALYRATIIYVIAYSGYHVYNPNTIDVIVGCMMLVVARFYQTNETPYMATFLFLLAARLVHKLYHSMWGKQPLPGRAWCVIRHCFMAADVALFLLLFFSSYVPSFRSPLQAHMCLIGILYAAFCLGSFISLDGIRRQAT